VTAPTRPADVANATTPATTTTAFIARWSAASGSERANYQLFVTELCELLGTPESDPASDDTRDNAYVFERRVQFVHGDGTRSPGFIDCSQRGRFVLEAKKVGADAHTKGFDDALLSAPSQAESYARARPAADGRPPFLVVVDVGHVTELYAEFSRSGATYRPLLDTRSHRIHLTDLHDERIRERLRTLWLNPLALDPARTSAKVTRAVSADLALLATSLEAPGPHGQHAPQAVAGVLTASARPIAIEVIEAALTGHGPCKRRIPQILEALAALGRARVVNGLWTLG
jgi:hypothetical protein